MVRVSLAMRTVVTALWIGAASLPVMAAEITDITVRTRPGNAEQVEIRANGPLVVQKSFTLQNPDRAVVDLQAVGTREDVFTRRYTGKLLQKLRFGKYDQQTSRLVLDLRRPASLKATANGSRLILDLAPAREGEAATPVRESAAGALPAEKTPAPKQLPLVVIDAGHGGQDPGALGLHQTHERDVTLNFARALKKSLIATGRYRAALTRDTDTFIMLHERVNIARKAKADILISLHADSNPNAQAQGLSVYTLSATASDAEAAALAEHENKADIITGIDLNTTDADVAGILIDLTQRETMNKSTQLADAIVDKLHPGITKLPKPHRFAGFRVLKAPDVPSVLIELGFLSNANDERMLLTPDYRDKVVSSVIKGIDRFYDQ